MEAESLSLLQGIVAVKGTDDDGFLLTIMGIGVDGSNVEFSPESETGNSTYVSLDFGAVDGQ